MILNLMPCVLPVLSIKAVSVLESGESPARARRHALLYTAGVLSSFAVVGGVIVGLRSAGHALGWGAQLQQPLVVAVLACVMFAVGLSMSGVWHVGGRWTGMGHAPTTKSGPTGRLLHRRARGGGGDAMHGPVHGRGAGMGVHRALVRRAAGIPGAGLGLALPFLLIGLMLPSRTRPPRPGAWMETFKQALAFPLYLTAAWLAGC
jgi:thiol:disulfide interchange protein DsbD